MFDKICRIKTHAISGQARKIDYLICHTDKNGYIFSSVTKNDFEKSSLPVYEMKINLKNVRSLDGALLNSMLKQDTDFDKFLNKIPYDNMASKSSEANGPLRESCCICIDIVSKNYIFPEYFICYRNNNDGYNFTAITGKDLRRCGFPKDTIHVDLDDTKTEINSKGEQIAGQLANWLNSKNNKEYEIRRKPHGFVAREKPQ